MVGFMGIGIGRSMKRKDSDAIDQFSHDFSDFSLSSHSPARKIRRLDADLPPIMEEEEPEISSPIIVEELDSESVEAEGKAIVVFKPLELKALPCSNTNMSVSVDPHFISAFNEEFIRRWGHQKPMEQDQDQDQDRGSRNDCLAVVPWAPPPPAWASMEVEESNNGMDVDVDVDVDEDEDEDERAIELQGLAHQWQWQWQWQQQQQQLCMVPLPLPHHTTPQQRPSHASLSHPHPHPHPPNTTTIDSQLGRT